MCLNLRENLDKPHLLCITVPGWLNCLKTLRKMSLKVRTNQTVIIYMENTCQAIKDFNNFACMVCELGYQGEGLCNV